MNLSSQGLSPVLRAEVDEVYAALENVAETLSFPLNNLVRSEIGKADPCVRAGVVLAVAYNFPEKPRLREQRIHLASALEMLHIALNVHKLLLPTTATYNNPVGGLLTVDEQEPSPIEQTDKAVMGSTILAGDFCFSRSAAMATKTGNPEVVNIFAEALKSVSEAHLRSIFDESVLSAEEDETLLLAGIEAASKLTNAPKQELSGHIEISTRLMNCLRLTVNQPGTLLDELETYSDQLTESQIARWREIIVWLTA